MFSLSKFQAVARRIPCVSLLLVAVSLVTYFVTPLATLLQFDRTAIAAGEVWRVVTCHLTHWSLDHLVWDAGAVLVLGLLCEVPYRRAFAWCLAGSAVLVPLAVGTLIPEMNTYRGLSGIDSALFTLLAVTMLGESLTARRYTWAALSGAVLLAFAAKIGFEYTTGATLFVDSAATNMVPVPLAHVVGGIVGGVCGLFRSISPRWMTFPGYSSQVFIASKPSRVSE